MSEDQAIDIPELRLHGRVTCSAAPVQVEGTIGSHAFYFRARHEHWSFAVALSADIDPADIFNAEQGFFREASYGSSPSEASRMPVAAAREIIASCAKA